MKKLQALTQAAIMTIVIGAIQTGPVTAADDPPANRKAIAGQCTFPSNRVVARLLKDKITAQLTALGYKKLKVRVSIENTSIKVPDLIDAVGVFYSNGDPNTLEISVDNIYTECELALPVTVTIKAVDAQGVATNGTKKTTPTVKGVYR